MIIKVKQIINKFPGITGMYPQHMIFLFFSVVVIIIYFIGKVNTIQIYFFYFLCILFQCGDILLISSEPPPLMIHKPGGSAAGLWLRKINNYLSSHCGEDSSPSSKSLLQQQCCRGDFAFPPQKFTQSSLIIICS